MMMADRVETPGEAAAKKCVKLMTEPPAWSPAPGRARCPSDDAHDSEDVKDPQRHYLECLKHTEKEAFWDLDHEFWQHEVRRIMMDDKAVKAAGQALNAAVKTRDSLPDDEVIRRTAVERVREAVEKAQEVAETAWEPAVKQARDKIGYTASHIWAFNSSVATMRKALEKSRKEALEAFEKNNTPQTDRHDYGDVVSCLEWSGEWWRDPAKKERGVTEAELEQKWVEKAVETYEPKDPVHPRDHEADREYDVDRELNAYFMRLHVEVNQEVEKTDKENGKEDGMMKGKGKEVGKEKAKTEKEMMMEKEEKKEKQKAQFKKCHVRGGFPDQRVSMFDLLNHEHSDGEKPNCILSYTPPDKTINYVHIPCNNMAYVEKIIPKYYREESEPLALDDGPFSNPSQDSRTYMLLRPQFWRGNQHGMASSQGSSGLPVHERHIRPLCEVISSDKPSQDKRNIDSIALFMPFLHWEFDRQRFKIARIIDGESERQRKRNLDEEARTSEGRTKKWGGNGHQKAPPASVVEHLEKKERAEKKKKKKKELKSKAQKWHDEYAPPLRRGTNDAVGNPGDVVVLRNGPFRTDKNGRTIVWNARGQYLLDAARLYEAIYLFKDRMMIKKYLSEKDAPLHPRRTLDQSYSWTLRTTRDLDRDQVVYRGTSMDLRFAHKLTLVEDQCKPKHAWHSRMGQKVKGWVKSPLGNGKTSAAKSRLPRHEREAALEFNTENEKKKAEKMKDHKRWELSGTVDKHRSWKKIKDAKSHLSWEKTEDDKYHYQSCDQCRDDIRKTARVVMVDQLWMWILDGHTIVTCFPRRYGVNKRDPSGVYRAIRKRVETNTVQIKSVFDLALIIIKECSNTLLDRSQSQDLRPQIIDIFAEAIGRIEHKLTIQYERLWHWTKQANASNYYLKSRKYEMLETSDMSESYYSQLLDINPEGELMKEISDIIDELTIMISIKKKQKELIERFVRNVKQYFLNNGNGVGKVNEHHRHSFSGSIRNGLTVPQSAESEAFELLADEVQTEIGDRLKELEELKQSAVTTAENVKALLPLKQQEASVVQAREAVKQGRVTVRQSQAIVVLTVVTICFLPPSFISSMFGMNNTTLDPDPDEGRGMELGQQLYIMFPVSFGIIFVALWIAFSTFVRTLFWTMWKVLATAVMVKLKLYYLRVSIFGERTSERLTDWTEKRINNMRDGVQQDYNKNEMDRKRRKAKKQPQQKEKWEMPPPPKRRSPDVAVASGAQTHGPKSKKRAWKSSCFGSGNSEVSVELADMNGRTNGNENAPNGIQQGTGQAPPS